MTAARSGIAKPQPRHLSVDMVEQYRRDGFCFPVRVMSADEAATLRARLEAHEATTGRPLDAAYRKHKVHALFTWTWELIHHPRILDAVEDLIGPDILCWSSSLFIKEAGDPSFVSWHQDAMYWGLSSSDVVTAWVALSPSTVQSGAMKVVPGSHLNMMPHRDTFAAHNMLTRGQEVMIDIAPSETVDLVLQPGEMSLHHVGIIHGSEPNRADDRRIGYAIRYVPTSTRKVAGPRDSATLVRGIDMFGHFDQDPRPERDFSPDVAALHRDIHMQHATLATAAALTAGKGKT